MAESLNKAFIKAYRKNEEHHAAPSPATEASSEAVDGYMVRIDTSSVAIPEPHLTRPQSKQVVVSKVKAQETRKPPQAFSAERSKAPEPEASLEDSIAEQMREASHWLDASYSSGQVMLVESFIGSLPQVSGSGVSSPKASSESQPNLEPKASIEPKPSQTPQIATSVDTPKHQPNTVAPRPQPPAAMAEPREEYAEISTDEVGESEPAKLEAPITPALSVDEVRRIVEKYAREREAQGEIFRLDQPNYEARVPAPEAEDDVASAEEISAEFEATVSDIDMDAKAARREAAKAVEEGLRQAQNRRFNAAWEVDEFQWPPVCVELLQQGESKLTKVAEDLSKACYEGLQVLAVTSPESGEGRTTVACCLAKLAAVSGLRVAVVDGDLENPSLSYQTNLDIDFDWRAAVLSQLPLEEVAIHSIADQITLVPLVSPVPEQELAAGDNRIALMMQELSESFDLVIVDMGHMASTKTMVASLAQQGIINAVVTVVDNRIASPQRIEECLRRIRRFGVSSVGLVENFAA